jgi:phosphoglycerate dehydrogenase-like enzyme
VSTLTVAIAAPVPHGIAERLTELEPRLDLRYEPDLLPPMRHPADFEGDPAFRRSPADQERFTKLLDDAEALYGIPDLDPAALRRTVRANPRLRWVHTMAAGGGAQVRAANLEPDELARIVFTTSAGVHALPLAEFALFGLLAGAKTLPRLRAQQQRHEWTGRWTMRQLAEQTVLVAGLGGIGRRVVSLLAALDARVIGVSRHPVELPGLHRVVHPDDLVAVAGEVDAVVTTLPGTDATTGLFGGAFFTALRPGATVVNVGRGTVIDEPALVAALRTGQVGFAALDVFAAEPLPVDSPLWDLPNVLVSPHTAALSAHEDRRIAEVFAANATRLLDGEELLNRVDVKEFY